MVVWRTVRSVLAERVGDGYAEHLMVLALSLPVAVALIAFNLRLFLPLAGVMLVVACCIHFHKLRKNPTSDDLQLR